MATTPTTQLAQLIYDAYGDQLYKKEWFTNPVFKSFVVSQLDKQMVTIVSLYLANRNLFLMDAEAGQRSHGTEVWLPDVEACDDIAGKLEDAIFKVMDGGQRSIRTDVRLPTRDGTGPLDDRGYMCHVHTLTPPVDTLLEQQIELCQQMMADNHAISSNDVVNVHTN